MAHLGLQNWCARPKNVAADAARTLTAAASSWGVNSLDSWLNRVVALDVRGAVASRQVRRRQAERQRGIVRGRRIRGHVGVAGVRENLRAAIRRNGYEEESDRRLRNKHGRAERDGNGAAAAVQIRHRAANQSEHERNRHDAVADTWRGYERDRRGE